ncbi:MAG: hypothetical protein QXU18_11460 [Thermoplasmatales archaeon]
MYSVAMDVGKHKTYGIVKRDGTIVKEGYLRTNRDEFDRLLEGTELVIVIVEASPSINSKFNASWA